ncbi:MAG: hypothetical protein R3A52_23700 [Polyangiales bacterium]
MRFDRVPEPPEFGARVRERGAQWLREHPTERLRDYWREFTPELRRGFRCLCAYSAMWIQSGDVDHFAPTASNRALAYEWSNYRYADGSINSRKQGLAVEKMLDPFEVRDEWFEVLLPSLQLVVTEACPPTLRGRAQTMLDRLGIGHAEWIIEVRQGWYDEWVNERLTLEGLDRRAPLLARANRKREAARAAGAPSQ